MASKDRRYFTDLYASDPDPWSFETSWYEHRKYATTLAALPEARYRSGFEPGCSIGVLSSLLAARCDRLLATDLVPAAVEQASERLHGAPHVRVEQRAIPERWPGGTFDLVVLSEIAYYFDAATLEEIAARVTASTCLGASVVGVHWRGPTDYPLSGDAAHDVLGASPLLDRIVHHVEPRFLLDVWRRIP